MPDNELTINTFISASHFENGDDEFMSVKENIFDENTLKEINSCDKKGINFSYIFINL